MDTLLESPQVEVLEPDSGKYSYNKRQQIFIDHYIVTLNATEAAKAAGYSANSARWQGSKLLTNPYIRQRIEVALLERQKDISREKFVNLALRDYESLPATHSNRPRFLELAGRTLNYLNPDAVPMAQTINIVFVKSKS